MRTEEAYNQLQQTFEQTAGVYSSDRLMIAAHWREIVSAYSSEGRFYHTLSHLDNLLFQLSKVKEQTADWDTLLFSLFYHDIVYDATAPDNEEKSAELAVARLNQIGFPQERIAKCSAQILATKGHSVSEDNDTNLFTDADLSILGMPWEDYAAYFGQVRNEYAVYPDELYNPGRTAVLKHFAAMPTLFKTPFFSSEFGRQAEENIRKELAYYTENGNGFNSAG